MISIKDDIKKILISCNFIFYLSGHSIIYMGTSANQSAVIPGCGMFYDVFTSYPDMHGTFGVTVQQVKPSLTHNRPFDAIAEAQRPASLASYPYFGQV